MARVEIAKTGADGKIAWRMRLDLEQLLSQLGAERGFAAALAQALEQVPAQQPVPREVVAQHIVDVLEALLEIGFAGPLPERERLAVELDHARLVGCSHAAPGHAYGRELGRGPVGRIRGPGIRAAQTLADAKIVASPDGIEE